MLWSFKGPVAAFEHHRGLDPRPYWNLRLKLLGGHRRYLALPLLRGTLLNQIGKGLPAAPIQLAAHLSLRCSLHLRQPYLVTGTNNHGVRPVLSVLTTLSIRRLPPPHLRAHCRVSSFDCRPASRQRCLASEQRGRCKKEDRFRGQGWAITAPEAGILAAFEPPHRRTQQGNRVWPVQRRAQPSRGSSSFHSTIPYPDQPLPLADHRRDAALLPGFRPSTYLQR